VINPLITRVTRIKARIDGDSRVWRTIFHWAIAAFFAAQFVIAIPHFQNILEPLRTVPNISDADKLRIQWGDVFDQLDFIRSETPDNAVIQMKEDGRPEFDQYFLYPRRVIYDDKPNAQAEYIFVQENYPPFPVIGDKRMLDATHGLIRVQR
jgi:hypothetical protein